MNNGMKILQCEMCYYSSIFGFSIKDAINEALRLYPPHTKLFRETKTERIEVDVEYIQQNPQYWGSKPLVPYESNAPDFHCRLLKRQLQSLKISTLGFSKGFMTFTKALKIPVTYYHRNIDEDNRDGELEIHKIESQPATDNQHGRVCEGSQFEVTGPICPVQIRKSEDRGDFSLLLCPSGESEAHSISGRPPRAYTRLRIQYRLGDEYHLQGNGDESMGFEP